MAQSPLCPSYPTLFGYEYVSSVSINGQTRQGNTGYNGPGYMDYTGSSITSLVAGNTYPVSVTVVTNSTWTEYVKIWFDFNGNGNLQDAGELVFDQVKSFAGVATYSGNVTVPTNAYNGDVFIRVIMVYSSSPQLCGSYGYGNTLDFKATISGGLTSRKLTVSRSGPSGSLGHVISSPAGINTANGIYSANFPDGSAVTLTASNAATGAFTSWSGDAVGTSSSIAVPMSADKTIVANFANRPTVSTTAISNITGTSAASGGYVSSDGGLPVSQRGIVWSTSVSPTLENNSTSDGSGTGTYTSSLSSLSSNTTYYVRAYATNSLGISYGNEVIFKTLPANPTSISASTELVCHGSSATLTANGAQGTVYWYTESCGGTFVGMGNSISVTPTASTTYFARNYNGSYSSGCASINITVGANVPPVPSVENLPDVVGECSATAIAPSATDGCGNTITGITNDPTTYTEQGNYTITWTYTDASGNTSNQTQKVIVQDVTPPTITELSPISVDNDQGQCGAVINYTLPTASDNCTVVGSQTFTYTGQIVNWTVPQGVTLITVHAKGAQGGGTVGGKGASIKGTVNVTPGETLKILVGQKGLTDQGHHPPYTLNFYGYSGGGGSFIVKQDNSPLIIAGGGGGTSIYDSPGQDGQISTNGGHISSAIGGTNGLGGQGGNLSNMAGCGYPGSGGGGLIGNGGGFGNGGGRSFINGGNGGVDYTENCVTSNSGGFGGGGAGGNGGGGGGGYSGGAGGDNDNNLFGINNYPGGGGGGSFNAGTNQENLSGIDGNTGDGQVVITWGGSNVTITQIAGLPSGSTFPVGVTTNTFEAVDAAGNKSTSSFTVTVLDKEAPVPDVTSLPDVNAECSTALTVPSAKDICTGVITAITTDPTEYTTQGEYVVTWIYSDGNGNSSSQTQKVIVKDVTPPSITAPAAITSQPSDAGICGAINASINLGAPATDDNCGVATVTNNAPAQFPVGTTTVTWTVTDVNGLQSSATQDVTVVDEEAPVITHNSNQTLPNDAGKCGAVFSAIAAATDNCYVGNPTGVRSDGKQLTEDYPVGTTTITWNVTDVNGNPTSVIQTVTVTNADPVITSVAGPTDPVAVNVPINLVVAYTDNNVSNATINWGDGSAVQTVSNPAASFTTPHIYTAAGVYTVNVSLTDACGSTASYAHKYVVIYDPSAGFVTGAGWITSPTGAYTPDPTLFGKATFGFVSKYQKGAKVPTGNTEFQFHAAGMNFKSTSYEWLVISGSKAQYKGVGTINGGTEEYGFILTATDGALVSSSTPDKLRIKIWNAAGTVYDNQMGAALDADAITAIENGSIIIHVPKGKTSTIVSDQSVMTVDAYTGKLNVQVRPNPSTVAFELVLRSSSDQPAVLRVVDAAGRVLESRNNISANGTQRVGETYRPGVYFAEVLQGTERVRVKLIKQPN